MVFADQRQPPLLRLVPSPEKCDGNAVHLWMISTAKLSIYLDVCPSRMLEAKYRLIGPHFGESQTIHRLLWIFPKWCMTTDETRPVGAVFESCITSTMCVVLWASWAGHEYGDRVGKRRKLPASIKVIFPDSSGSAMSRHSLIRLTCGVLGVRLGKKRFLRDLSLVTEIKSNVAHDRECSSLIQLFHDVPRITLVSADLESRELSSRKNFNADFQGKAWILLALAADEMNPLSGSISTLCLLFPLLALL